MKAHIQGETYEAWYFPCGNGEFTRIMYHYVEHSMRWTIAGPFPYVGF